MVQIRVVSLSANSCTVLHPERAVSYVLLILCPVSLDQYNLMTTEVKAVFVYGSTP